jgi:tetratricopeptide (TPR) repeat protein
MLYMKSPLRFVFALFGAVLVSLAVPAHAATVPDEVVDAPIAGYQRELLNLAFETATAMPIKPHIKNRSRAQEEVVDACFKLDQARLALSCIRRIDNWRRGAAYADFAFYCARQGWTDTVQHYLDLAAQISEETEDWRRDRIRAKIARTYAWLGQEEEAARFEAGAGSSEAGKADSARAMRADEEVFDAQMKRLEGILATKHLDLVRNALQAGTRLFDRFYDDKPRRDLVEERVQTGWSGLPRLVRMELMMDLIEVALAHGDHVKALERVNDTQIVLDRFNWSAEYRVPVIARLGGLRYLAGDTERGRADVDHAVDLFNEKRKTIINMFRAEALHPVAEAYQAMGDTAAALAVYRKAVEEGVVNINSRPRAEDLAATCCSMAVHAVEPDAELLARVHEIHEGLGDPW